MFLDGKFVLRILDTATYFYADTFIDAHAANYGQSGQGVCFDFVMTWCTMYIGH